MTFTQFINRLFLILSIALILPSVCNAAAVPSEATLKKEQKVEQRLNKLQERLAAKIQKRMAKQEMKSSMKKQAKKRPQATQDFGEVVLSILALFPALGAVAMIAAGAALAIPPLWIVGIVLLILFIPLSFFLILLVGMNGTSLC